MKKFILALGALMACSNAFAYYPEGREELLYDNHQEDRWEQRKDHDSKPTYTTKSQEKDYGRPYIGFDYVKTLVEYNNDDLDFSFEDVFEDSLDSFAVSLGSRFHKYFGAEIYFQQSADGEKEVNYLYTKINYKSYGLDMLVYLPATDNFSLLGSVGVGYYDMEVEAEILGRSGKASVDDLGPRLGIGAQLDLSEHFAVRAMARYSDPGLDDTLDNLWEFSFGVRMTF